MTSTNIPPEVRELDQEALKAALAAGDRGCDLQSCIQTYVDAASSAPQGQVGVKALVQSVKNNPPDRWHGAVGDPERIPWDEGWDAACDVILEKLAALTPQPVIPAGQSEREGHIAENDQWVGPFTRCTCGHDKLEKRGEFWCCTNCGASWGRDPYGALSHPSPVEAQGTRDE